MVYAWMWRVRLFCASGVLDPHKKFFQFAICVDFGEAPKLSLSPTRR